MTEPFKFVVSNDPAKARQAIGTLGVPADYDVSGSGDYMVNDTVRFTDPSPTPTADLSGLYRCIVDHTSGSPKVQPGRWQLVATGAWAGLSGKPAVMAVGATADEARAAIGAAQVLTTVAPLTTNTAPAAGVITPYNAAGGALSVTLPALSGLAAGDVLGVQKAAVDTSVNTVTFTRAGSDTFDSGATSLTLKLAAELRHLQVVSIAGTKYWKVIGGNTTLATLDGRFTPALPVGYYTPVGKSNGAVGKLDSGQTVSSFGNSTGGVVSGQIAHTVAATPGAAYYQVDVGARVRRVTCEVQWPSGSTGALAIVLPTSAWSAPGGTLSASTAGVHLVIYGNGIWHCSRFVIPGSTETIYADNTTNGRFADVRGDGKFHLVDLWIDTDTGVAVLFLPDGTATTFQSSYIINNTSTLAIWEQYEYNGPSDTPCVLRNLSVDTQARRLDSFVATKADIGALLGSSAKNQWPGASTAAASGTTTLVAGSGAFQQFYGTLDQTVLLPTGIPAWSMYIISNNSTGTVTVQSSAGGALGALATGNVMLVFSTTTNPTAAGDWYAQILATVNTTQTLTGKRVDPRVATAASASSLTPDIKVADVYEYTALAANLTIGTPSGAAKRQRIIYCIKDNGTSRTLTWNSIFRAIGVTLPTATTAGKWHRIVTEYNAGDTKWDVVTVQVEA